MCKSHNDDGKFGDKQVKAIKSGTTCGLHCLLNLIELLTLFDYDHYKIDLISYLIRNMDFKKIFAYLKINQNKCKIIWNEYTRQRWGLSASVQFGSVVMTLFPYFKDSKMFF